MVYHSLRHYAREAGQSIYDQVRWYRTLMHMHSQQHSVSQIPIIIYQMGKVGSSSLVRSLHACGMKNVYHVHRMNPNNISKTTKEHHRTRHLYHEKVGAYLYRTILQQHRPVKIITPVREPVGRNISAFFENFRYLSRNQHTPIPHTPAALLDLFLHHYPHNVPLTWFDDEMNQTLAVDVYAHPFPTEQGHMTIRQDPCDILILKVELADDSKAAAIARFLDLPAFQMKQANVGNTKDYASMYRDFLRCNRLPDRYIETMYQATYTRHFYGADEIARLREKWQHKP